MRNSISCSYVHTTQAQDAQGLTVQERVEKALEETSSQVAKLEESGRLISVVEAPNLKPPESSLGMVRQVRRTYLIVIK